MSRSDEPGDVPDDELLTRWSAGDVEAGTALFRRHYTAVYRFLRSKIDDDIEDVVQATFLACVESAERYTGASTFRTYLLGIARHKVLHHLRKWHRNSGAIDPESMSVESLTHSPSRVVAGREEEKLLFAALRQIPLDYQIVLELHYWEQMTVTEIGRVLECAPGTIKSRLHRGRALVRASIEALGKTDLLRRETSQGVATWARALRDRLAKPPA